jgi:hypothetical protein
MLELLSMIVSDLFVYVFKAYHFQPFQEEPGDRLTPSMLHYVSVSSWGWLALLARWSCCSERLGGFRDNGMRNSAMEMLKSLLHVLCDNSCGEFTLYIDFFQDQQQYNQHHCDNNFAYMLLFVLLFVFVLVWFKQICNFKHIIIFRLQHFVLQDWDNKWPRPMPCSSQAVLVKLNKDTSFGLAQLFTAVEQLLFSTPDQLAHKKLSEFRKAIQRRAGTLVDLFAVLCCDSKLLPIYQQVLWQCGAHLQKLSLVMLKGSVTAPRMTAKAIGMDDLLEMAHLLDRQLVRYVAASKDSARGYGNLSFCTDKSTVGGLGSGLQNTIFVTPGNVAIVSPPQATQLPNCAYMCEL